MIAQDLVNGRGDDPRVAGVIGRATATTRRTATRRRGAGARAPRRARSYDHGDRGTPTRPRTQPVQGTPLVRRGRRGRLLRPGRVDRLARGPVQRAGRGRPLPRGRGPVGSGKSSAVRAGLIPTLRAGALPGSDRWFYVEMLPGSHPFEELETALQHVAVDPPVGPARDARGRATTGSPRSSADPPRRRERARARRGPAGRGLHDGRGRAAPEPVPPEPRRGDAGTRRPAPGDRHAPGGLLRPPALRAGGRGADATRTATVVPLTPEELERAIDGRPPGSASCRNWRSSRRWSRTSPSDQGRSRSSSTR